MGKRHKGRNKRKRKKTQQPFVSICTPTFNRRSFFEHTIKCFLHQDYPQSKLEWIIIDDGTDHIEDMIPDLPNVHYYKYDSKMTLGKKRNLMHSKTKGDIIVYMDDDDYYPPERVSHAVNTLTTHKKALCAGSSEIYIWFENIQKMYQFGPYGPNHATAGTFAFKRELLNRTSYDDNACLAEEKQFLKDYTIPFVQLEPRKTILVFSHEHNTFDKRKLLNNDADKYVKESSLTVQDFIVDQHIINFYTKELSDLLNAYEPGDPKYKPDVIEYTKMLEARRKKLHETAQQNGSITIQSPDGTVKELTNAQVVTLLQQYQSQLNNNNSLLKEMQTHLNSQQDTITHLQTKLDAMNNKSIQLSERGCIDNECADTLDQSYIAALSSL